MFVDRQKCGEYGFLLTSTQPTQIPAVLLAAHVDVVGGPNELFQLRQAGGKLFGRGVYDMKGAIAGYLVLVDTLQKHLRQYDFGILVTSDEESADCSIPQLFANGLRPQAVVLF